MCPSLPHCVTVEVKHPTPQIPHPKSSCGDTYDFETWFQSKLLHVCFDFSNSDRVPLAPPLRHCRGQTPRTLHPELPTETRRPNPKPQTLIPKHQAPNPKPEALIVAPSTQRPKPQPFTPPPPIGERLDSGTYLTVCIKSIVLESQLPHKIVSLLFTSTE